MKIGNTMLAYIKWDSASAGRDYKSARHTLRRRPKIHWGIVNA
jgi:hypothetical protein